MNTKKLYIALGIIATTQMIFAAMSFFVPFFNSWIKSISSAELIIGILTIESTIIGSTLAWYQFEESERRVNFEKLISNSIGQSTHSQELTIAEFNNMFLAELMNCARGANMAYLGNYPPVFSNNKNLTKAYDDTLLTMKRRKGESLYFRRIIRLTKENWDWILKLCDHYQGIPTFSMALLEDSGDDQRNPLALSVQTVDGARTYLVAVYERDTFTPHRDLLISSTSVTKAFEVYYDRLWKRSIPVIELGMVDKKALALLGDKIKKNGI